MALGPAVRRLAEVAGGKQRGSAPPKTPEIETEAAVSGPPVARPPAGEVGLSGTLNRHGRIYSEANSKLQFERAYGTPGVAEWGEWEKLERTDHKVASALDMLEAPICDAKPKVVLPEELEAEEEEEEDTELNAIREQCETHAEFVMDVLARMSTPLASVLQQIVHYGLGYGFSLHEYVWTFRPDERVPLGTAVVLDKLAQRLPSSISSNGWVEENGELVAVKQSGVKDNVWRMIDLPADKLLLATWKRTGNNYQGFSAFRAGWYMAQVRARLLNMMAVGAEREALGVPVAEVEKDVVLTDDQRDELQTILENLVYHENAAAQLPPGVKIQWVFSAGANKGNLLELWQALGLAMLELVQAQQQSLGTSDTGARAVGEIHDATKNMFVASVRRWVEGVMDQVVRKLVDLNFGPQEYYPCFKLHVEEEEQKGTLTDLRSLIYAGAIHPTVADENVLRKRFGLDAIDPEEYARMVAEKKAAKEAMAGAFGKPKPGEEEEEEELSAGGLTIRLD